MEETRRCQYCDELIRRNAIKCRYCGSVVTDGDILKEQFKNPDTLIKQILGDRYDLKEVIGKGGMAVVYKAVQKSLDREVALKIVHQNLVHDKEFIERFLREARIGASLNHPNIVTIYDVGSLGPVHYMAMEFLRGETLRNMIKKEKLLTPAKTIEYLAPIAGALAYIHDKNLVHRDIKSSNIFITSTGKPVLTDFGIVYVRGQERLSAVGAVMGTPEYMSPEQAEGNVELDHRSDIYSFGTILFESMTGQVPFNHDNPLATINSLLNQPPPVPTKLNPAIPEWMSNLILSCLIKNRDSRIQDCRKIEKSLVDKQFSVGIKNDYDATRKFTRRFKKEDTETIDKINSAQAIVKTRKLNPIIILLTLLLTIIITTSIVYFNKVGNEEKQVGKILDLVNQHVNSQQFDKAYSLCIAGLEKYPRYMELRAKANEIIKLSEQQHDTVRSEPLVQKPVTETTPAAASAVSTGDSAISRATSIEQTKTTNVSLATTKKSESEVKPLPISEQSPSPPDRLTDAQIRLLKNLDIEMVMVHNFPPGSFYLGKYEVTQALWQRIIGNTPSIINRETNCPVENISPNEIAQFLKKLNMQTGLNFRLPTETEWEFAAAGGSSSQMFKYSGGNNIENMAWYEGNASGTYRPVGTKNANQLGIHDMSGNVWEICNNNITKGGSYMSPSNNCTISTRKNIGPGDRDWSTGFRLCLSF